ncbi:MAG TPA: DUF1345 domain-containing protein [Candidatus Aquabacterium excrementipullorum]|nr:DUF1345 domain-containing protein [Candidatus Aquabacterium excrementipullorum]
MKTTIRKLFHSYTPTPRWLSGHAAGRLLWTRRRLWLSVALASAIWCALPSHTDSVNRLLTAWCAFGLVYLLQGVALMLTADDGSIEQRARHEDEGAGVILLLIVLAAGASIGAVVMELAGGGARNGSHPDGPVMALAGASIATAWLLIHTAFALHYAHRYYLIAHGRHNSHGAPLDFPGRQTPVYLDFLYFSFTIGATSQTSDVGVATTRMRGLVLLHGMVSFLFNTTLLALTVNIGASLLRP